MAESGEGSGGDKAASGPLCVVCGDRANGMHYRALTCEGCKTFFRRNARKMAELKCEMGSNGQCVMDLYMRRHCGGCRMKKCLEVGMQIDRLWDKERIKTRKPITKKVKSAPQTSNQLPEAGAPARSDPPACLSSTSDAAAAPSAVEAPASQQSSDVIDSEVVEVHLKLVAEMKAAYRLSQEHMKKQEEPVPKKVLETVAKGSEAKSGRKTEAGTSGFRPAKGSREELKKKVVDDMEGSGARADLPTNCSGKQQTPSDSSQEGPFSCSCGVGVKTEPDGGPRTGGGASGEGALKSGHLASPTRSEQRRVRAARSASQGASGPSSQGGGGGPGDAGPLAAPCCHCRAQRETRAHDAGSGRVKLVPTTSDRSGYLCVSTDKKEEDDDHNDVSIRETSCHQGAIKGPSGSGLLPPHHQPEPEAGLDVSDKLSSRGPEDVDPEADPKAGGAHPSTGEGRQGQRQGQGQGQRGEKAEGGVDPDDLGFKFDSSVFKHIMEVMVMLLKSMTMFSKSLPGFRSLTWEDQASLIKGAYLEFMILTSAMLYNPETKSFFSSIIPGQEYNQDVGFLGGLQKLTESVFQFADKMTKLQLTEEEAVMLYSICIMTPDRQELSAVETVAKEQQMLVEALQTCTRLHHPGQNMFPKTLMLLTDVRDVTEKYMDDIMNLKLEGKSMLPLLNEIFES